MQKKQYYRIAKDRHSEGYVFRGSGKPPLQDRFPAVEDLLEKRRPNGKADRGNSVYLKEDKNFSRAGLTNSVGYIHTVDPADEV